MSVQHNNTEAANQHDHPSLRDLALGQAFQAAFSLVQSIVSRLSSVLQLIRDNVAVIHGFLLG